MKRGNFNLNYCYCWHCPFLIGIMVWFWNLSFGLNIQKKTIIVFLRSDPAYPVCLFWPSNSTTYHKVARKVGASGRFLPAPQTVQHTTTWHEKSVRRVGFSRTLKQFNIPQSGRSRCVESVSPCPSNSSIYHNVSDFNWGPNQIPISGNLFFREFPGNKFSWEVRSTLALPNLSVAAIVDISCAAEHMLAYAALLVHVGICCAAGTCWHMLRCWEHLAYAALWQMLAYAALLSTYWHLLRCEHLLKICCARSSFRAVVPLSRRHTRVSVERLWIR